MTRFARVPSLDVLLVATSIAAASCSSPQAEPDAVPEATATAEATAVETAPPADPTAEPTAEAPATSAPTAAPTAKGGKRTFKFEGYNGPKVTKSFAGTPVAWAVRPAGDDGSFENNKLDLLAFVKTQGDEVLVQLGKDELWLPQALTAPGATPANLATGDLVLANTGEGAAVGRVTGVKKDAGLAKVSFVRDGAAKEIEVSRQATLKLDGKITFGRPVGFKEGSTWLAGQYAGGDKTKAFVAMGKGWRVVDMAALKPLEIGAPHAKGASVWAATEKGLVPAIVEDVVAGSMKYKVKLASGGSVELPFERVSAPLE